MDAPRRKKRFLSYECKIAHSLRASYYRIQSQQVDVTAVVCGFCLAGCSLNPAGKHTLTRESGVFRKQCVLWIKDLCKFSPTHHLTSPAAEIQHLTSHSSHVSERPPVLPTRPLARWHYRVCTSSSSPGDLTFTKSENILRSPSGSTVGQWHYFKWPFLFLTQEET